MLSGVADVLLRGAFNAGGQVQDLKGCVCVFFGDASGDLKKMNLCAHCPKRRFGVQSYC